MVGRGLVAICQRSISALIFTRNSNFLGKLKTYVREEDGAVFFKMAGDVNDGSAAGVRRSAKVQRDDTPACPNISSFVKSSAGGDLRISITTSSIRCRRWVLSRGKPSSTKNPHCVLLLPQYNSSPAHVIKKHANVWVRRAWWLSIKRVLSFKLFGSAMDSGFWSAWSWFTGGREAAESEGSVHDIDDGDTPELKIEISGGFSKVAVY